MTVDPMCPSIPRNVAHMRRQPPTGRLPGGAAAVLFVVAMVAQAVYPGDIPFINDEPRLLALAYRANAQGTLADKGLPGSFGMTYFPLAVWFYQLLLAVTHNVPLLALMKIAVSWSGTALGLWWWSGHTARDRLPLLLIPLSPYLWLFGRQLWDNCFLIPLATVLAAGLAAFLRRPTRISLVAVVGVVAVMALLHPMTFMVAAPLAAVMLAARWPWFRQHLVATFGAAAVACAVLGGYGWRLSQSDVARHGQHQADWLDRAFGGIAGIRVFTHFGFDRYLPEFYRDDTIWPAAVSTALMVISGVSVVAAAVGLKVVVCRLYRARCIHHRRLSPRDWFGVTALLTVAAMTCFFLVTGAEAAGHYYNAAWPFYFYFIWVGFDRLRGWRWPWGRAVIIQLGASVLLLAGLAAHVHIHSGNRSWFYGPVLRTQLACARRIAGARARTKIVHMVPSWRRFRTAPVILTRLIQTGDGRADADDGAIRYVDVRYANPDNQLDARLEVVERPRPQP